jgi:ACT domain-containing protein
VVRNGSRRVSALGSVKQQMRCNDCQRFYLVNENVLNKELRHIEKIKAIEAKKNEARINALKKNR